MEIDRYPRLVGKLNYPSHSRPDIAFAISLENQHMNSPKESHLDAVYKILKYLKEFARKGLLSKVERKEAEVFTDADWVGSIEDRRSTTDYCTFICGNLVTWRGKK